MEIIPMVIKKTEKGGEKTYDLFSYLLNNRIIFVTGPITDDKATSVSAQLLFLQHISNEKVHIHINSGGGSIDAMVTIRSTMQILQNNGIQIATWCIGLAASAASVLFVAGTKGQRNIFKYARLMLHQPSSGVGGTATQMIDYAEETIRLKKQLIEMYAECTDISKSTLAGWLERDTFFDAESAVRYGLADNIVGNKIIHSQAESDDLPSVIEG